MRSHLRAVIALLVLGAAPGLLRPAESATTATPTALANQVEPLSNGLRLSMTQDEIIRRFGAPTDKTADARSFGYASFFVVCGSARKSIWHLTLRRGVKLHNGLGVGSPRRDVQTAFGSNDRTQYGQYRLAFSYGRDDTVTQIKIDPAQGDFVDYRAATAHHLQKPPTPPSTAATGANAAIAGTWWLVAPSWSSGTIEIKADGSYTRPGDVTGHYVIDGDTVIFDGNLKTWNNGRAKLDGDSLIFEWSNPDGSPNYFAFRRAP